MLAFVASIFRRGLCPHGGRSKSLDHSPCCSLGRQKLSRIGIEALSYSGNKIDGCCLSRRPNREDFVGCVRCLHRILMRLIPSFFG
jgi:hypothetical protein